MHQKIFFKRERNAEHLSDAKYLLLNGVPTSDEARHLGDELTALLFPQTKRGRGKPIDLQARQAILMAITADVLLASSITRWLAVYHSLDKNSFRIERLSYDQFQACRKALEGHGFLERIGGFHARNMKFGDTFRPQASRWRPTEAFLRYCQEHGITPENTKKHFRFKMPEHPLQLRGPSKWEANTKHKGMRLRFDPTPHTERLEKDVKALNEFMSHHVLSGTNFQGFHRIFNDAHDPKTYEWNRGGRLYSGEGGYQSLSKEDRLALKINGSSVAEIDIKASHLTILYGLAGLKMPKGDPYKIRGLPREFVKLWFMSCFGAQKMPIRWPRVANETFRALFPHAKTSKTLEKTYPIAETTKKIAKQHGPALDYFFRQGLSSLRFQFIESEIILSAMGGLRQFPRPIPSYPVHDSLIVRKKDVPVAKQCLEFAFSAKARILPQLDVRPKVRKSRDTT